jgi:hypothetical protein
MHRNVAYTLLALALFLVLFPLAVPKPGMPLTLKADEPAYYLAALSLARDHDLRVEVKDLRRIHEEFPYDEARNLILMSDDGWRHVYFGKPYIYSLFAAPFAGLFGADGMVAFNMLLMMGMVWMGTSYLRQYNSDGLSAVYAAGFFLLSGSFPYVFWMHPEIFNMFWVTTALYLVFRRPEERPELAGGWPPAWLRWLDTGVARALLSGACLTLAAYNKPMLAALGLPCIVMLWRRAGLKATVRWLAGAIVGMALIAGVAIALSGHASAYLGVQRQGVTVHDTDHLPVQPEPLSSQAVVQHRNSWSWMFRLPDIHWRKLAENSGYFLWGRHTGLIPYQPIAFLSLLLFLFRRRHEPERWALLGGIVLVALSFLIWIPFNWHGGGGFVGNRYFVSAVPGFLFLVSGIRPRWLPLVGYAAAGLLVGPLVFTPLGAPVVYPTLQSHVRSWPFSLFPVELSLERRIPGYRGSVQGDLYFWGRKDVFKPGGEVMWIFGGVPAEIWIKSYEPIDSAVFQVVDVTPGNRVTLSLSGDRQVLHFPDPLPEKRAAARVVFHPTHANHARTEGNRTVYYYRLVVKTVSGRRLPPPPGERPDAFSVGAGLYYLGTTEQVQANVFDVEWSQCSAPDHAEPGTTVPVSLALKNASAAAWPIRRAARVRIGWRWIGADGRSVRPAGPRIALPRSLPPGGKAHVDGSVIAPDDPGTYRLEFEPVYEHVGWFGTHDDDAICRTQVHIDGETSPRRSGGDEGHGDA